jgi:hypothetical protein
MDKFQRIVDFFGWHRTKARPIALEASPFRKLPLELIFLIASYLPLESAAILSLSCYPLYSCLKTECLQPLKEGEYSVINGFLRFLERDLPTHLLCPHCNKLHSMSFAKRHLTSGSWFPTSKPWLLCRSVDRHNYIEGRIFFDFSSTIFRMAMKAHRQGHDTTKLLGLLSYGKRNIVQIGFVEQPSAAVRIQDGSLLAREQRVFMVPSSQKTPIPWHPSINICLHIQFLTMRCLAMHGIRIPHADEIEGHENKQGIIYCEYCYSEFRVDFKSYGEAGNAMFVTKWIDIGEGRDISDHKWTSRFRGVLGEARTKAAFQRGSICAAFEQKDEFKFDSLLIQQDKKALCRKSRPGPDKAEVSCDRVQRYYMVSRGRFLPF